MLCGHSTNLGAKNHLVAICFCFSPHIIINKLLSTQILDLLITMCFKYGTKDICFTGLLFYRLCSYRCVCVCGVWYTVTVQ